MSHITRLLAGATLAAVPSMVSALDITVQSRHPPLQFEGAAAGGAHPIGGPGKHFVDVANRKLAAAGIRFRFHVSGGVHPADADDVSPPEVELSEWGSLHNAVAAGAIDAALGIPADSGLGFGEFYAGGVPFGLRAEEFIAFLYHGGGLDLQQEFYDEAFDEGLVVLPVGITGAQGAGFFPQPIGDPASDPELTPEAAMAEFCARPMIVRYPGGAQAVLQEACRAVGGDVDIIGALTRCEDPGSDCGEDHDGNPVAFDPTRLSFGGFAPGVIPHTMYTTGNIDAFELNLPIDDVQFLKMALGMTDMPDAEVDVSQIVPPYHYGSGWHQPWLYAELIVNRAVWDGMEEGQRNLIGLAAQASTLDTFARRTAAQGAAMDLLEANGVTHMRWPKGLLALMHDTAADALDGLARAEAEDGDDTFARALSAMRAFTQSNERYFDYANVPQGRYIAPTAP